MFSPMALSLLTRAFTALRPIRAPFPYFREPSRNFRSVSYATKETLFLFLTIVTFLYPSSVSVERYLSNPRFSSFSISSWLVFFFLSVFLLPFFQIRANYVGENENCKSFVVPSAGFGRCNSTASSGLGLAASSGIHSLPSSNPVVSAGWLHANLKEPDVKVIGWSLIILL
jgi:hypothetical protein